LIGSLLRVLTETQVFARSLHILPRKPTDRNVVWRHFAHKNEENNMALIISMNHQYLKNISFQSKKLH
jgi:hypothetical protein